ncbi:hypothetical protein E4U14_000380 [Claviceps sp. LM454 group G7]|nr:hypothetical protein E4U14_000380 [Claviceps sp. LM454 group G7]
MSAPGRIGGGLEVLQDNMNHYDRKMNILNTHAGVHLAELAAEYGGCPMHIGTYYLDYLAKRSKILSFELWESY